jgi:GNAT superfamily N-acetyltransferase
MGSAEILVKKAPVLTPELKAYLEADPIGNAYPLTFVNQEPHRTSFWVARRDDQPCGHLFVYEAHEFSTLWAYLAGDSEVVSRLLDEIPRKHTVATAPSESSSILSHLPGVTEVFVQQIMVVERGEERLVDPTPATRLTPEQALPYAQLVVPAVVPITEKVVELNREFLRTEVVYGIFAGSGALAAVAGTNARSPAVWMVTGVQTASQFRRRGFGAKVVSAVTREALAAVGRSALYVDREEQGAIRLYERLGYRTIRECTVVDFGTKMAR